MRGIKTKLIGDIVMRNIFITLKIRGLNKEIMDIMSIPKWYENRVLRARVIRLQQEIDELSERA